MAMQKYTNFSAPRERVVSIVYSEHDRVENSVKLSRIAELDEITEMRIFNGKIDFLENMP